MPAALCTALGAKKYRTLTGPSLHCRIERRGTCQLSIALYSELVEVEAAGMLFPVNELRNMATLPARTQLLLYVDGDLLLDQTWSKAFREQPAKWVPRICHHEFQGLPCREFCTRDVSAALLICTSTTVRSRSVESNVKSFSFCDRIACEVGACPPLPWWRKGVCWHSSQMQGGGWGLHTSAVTCILKLLYRLIGV